MSDSMFPFSLNDLQTYFVTLVPASLVVENDAAFWLSSSPQQKFLAVLARPDDPRLATFTGNARTFRAGYTLLECPADHANARALCNALSWLTPKPIGLATSAGLGDRLGLATPGHVRAIRATGNTIVPIFSQQSIREMQRTGRSPDDVMTDATFGAFEAGWRGLLGADADHLKVPADIDACVAVGFSFYTIDPGAHVDSQADTAAPSVIAQQVAALPWRDLESTPSDLEKNYIGKTITLEDRALTLDAPGIMRAAAKYGRAVAHVAKMYRHLAAKQIPFEFEVSVDETETPTTHIEHVYIASELKRLGVRWVSLAPRYIGRFEKGVDYIGDVTAFENDFAIHAQIARALGPYKLSLHSGSDKFSVYPAAMRQTRGMVHLKTAGTSYLEALRTLAQHDSGLFRAIYVFARERYDTDKASYHVSAELARAPLAENVRDADWAALLDQFDAREILHVTFGSVLTTRTADNRLRFYDDLMAFLRAHPAEYAANLEKHFIRHLQPFTKS